MTTIQQLPVNEYLPYFTHFLNRLDDSKDLIAILENSGAEATRFFKSIPKEMESYRYADGKWDIKEIINHLIDTERIFNYRALCISRKDQTVLNGFDENEYAKYSLASGRDINDLIEEFIVVRQATIALFKSFTPKMLHYIGQAGSGAISVRALGFIIAGHETHHIHVYKERYLK
jgi:arsenate reductase-like glutaredoxin family protein